MAGTSVTGPMCLQVGWRPYIFVVVMQLLH